MKSKLKLELIDNYISLHRIIYVCNQRIFKANTNIETLLVIHNNANNLKSEFDTTFNSLKMNNNSLILLKSQLTSALENNITLKNIPSADKIINQLCAIKKEKEKILQKLTKKKRWAFF